MGKEARETRYGGTKDAGVARGKDAACCSGLFDAVRPRVAADLIDPLLLSYNS